jgi:hypothetical protein
MGDSRGGYDAPGLQTICQRLLAKCVGGITAVARKRSGESSVQ